MHQAGLDLLALVALCQSAFLKKKPNMLDPYRQSNRVKLQ